MLSYATLPYPIPCYYIISHVIQSPCDSIPCYSILSYPTLSYLMLRHPLLFHAILSNHTFSYLISSYYIPSGVLAHCSISYSRHEGFFYDKMRWDKMRWDVTDCSNRLWNPQFHWRIRSIDACPHTQMNAAATISMGHRRRGDIKAELDATTDMMLTTLKHHRPHRDLAAIHLSQGV